MEVKQKKWVMKMGLFSKHEDGWTFEQTFDSWLSEGADMKPITMLCLVVLSPSAAFIDLVTSI